MGLSYFHHHQLWQGGNGGFLTNQWSAGNSRSSASRSHRNTSALAPGKRRWEWNERQFSCGHQNILDLDSVSSLLQSSFDLLMQQVEEFLGERPCELCVAFCNLSVTSVVVPQVKRVQSLLARAGAQALAQRAAAQCRQGQNSAYVVWCRSHAF